MYASFGPPPVFQAIHQRLQYYNCAQTARAYLCAGWDYLRTYDVRSVSEMSRVFDFCETADDHHFTSWKVDPLDPSIVKVRGVGSSRRPLHDKLGEWTAPRLTPGTHDMKVGDGVLTKGLITEKEYLYTILKIEYRGGRFEAMLAALGSWDDIQEGLY